jgi:hypothetical protein
MAEKKTEGTTDSAATATATVTQAEAIRQALAHLGVKAANPEIQKFIKETFNLDMSLKRISTYKSEELKRMAKKGKKPAKPAAKASAPAAAHPVKAPSASATHAGNGKELARSLNAVRTIKALLAQFGAASIRDLITILER